MSRPRILTIDDDGSFLDAIVMVLNDNYDVVRAGTGADALALMKPSEFNAILLDIGLPDIDGLQLLKKIRTLDDLVPVVMLTGAGKTETVVQAIKFGAYDYLVKDLDRDRLLTCVRNAVIHEESERGRSNLAEVDKNQSPLIGVSSALDNIRDMINRVAPTDIPVLITGESGVGKDIIAHQIHLKSRRSKPAFVKINIPSIPDSLVESELFGHKKGAYTSADKDKPGLIELAHGGTLFVDEIGLASFAVQAKLLQVMDNGVFTPVGGTSSVKVDVRIVTATNKNLELEIKAKNFKDDLYYRIDGFVINVPPLRERKEDIRALLEYFMKALSMKTGNIQKVISAEAMRFLLDYSWPGNVRTIQKLVNRFAYLIDHIEISVAEVAKCLNIHEAVSAFTIPTSLESALRAREREIIEIALISNDYVVARAADSLGIHRGTLYEKIKSLGIDIEKLSHNGDKKH